ncbi:hypothetical protein GCM10028809_40420 [Spirosoma gilvum]
MMSIILAGLLGFMGYCWILLDLYQDIKLGRYEREPLDTIVEAGVIIAYCYVSFRFIQSKLKTAQPTHYSLSDATKAKTHPQSTGWFSKSFTTNRRNKPGFALRTRPHRFN